MMKFNGLLILFVLFVGGCGSGDQLTTAQHTQKAEESIDQGELNAAIIHLKNALQVDPNNPRARWMLGNLYLDVGNAEGAEKELRRSLELGIAKESIIPRLAKALFLQGEIDDAFFIQWESRITGDPRSDLLTTHARALLSKGDTEKAEKKIEEALSQTPESRYALTTKAYIMLSTKRAADGRGILEKVVEMAPDHAEAWSLIGDLDIMDNNPQKALEAYTRAIDNRHNDSKDRLKRALALIELQRLDDAEKDIDILRNRKLLSAEYAAGLIHYIRQNNDEAIDALLLVLKSNPNHLLANFFSALANYKLGNFIQAEEQATRVYAQNPNFVSGRKLLALIKARNRLFDQVEELLRPVVRMDETDTFAMNLLATALLKLGKTDEALSFFEKIVETHTQSAIAQLQLGVALLDSGESEKGFGHIKTSVDLDSEFQQADLILVLSYLRAKKFDQALTSAIDFRERNRSSPIPEIVLGLVYLAQNNKTNAAKSFQRANELAPGDPGANSNLAELAIQDEDFERARNHYELTLNHHPNHLPTLIKLGELETRAGNLSAMEKWLRTAVSMHPEEVQPRVLLANYRLLQGKPTEALDLLNAVENQGTNIASYRRILGKVQLATNSPERAKQTFEQLIKITPDSADAHFLLARTNATVGDIQGMKNSLEESLKIDPDYFPARLAYTRVLFLERDLKGAKESLDILEKSAGAHPDVKLLDGLIASATNRPDDAVASLREAFKTAPTTNTMLAFARQQWLAGDREASLIILEKWVREYPESLKSRFALAEAYVASERVEDAVTQYRIVLDKDENNITALNNLAWHSRDRDPKQALELAQRATRLAPESTALLDTLAITLAYNKKFESAERTIDKALEKHPKNPSIRYTKGVILSLAGKHGESRKLLNELVNEPHTNFPEKQEAKERLKTLQTISE